MFTFDEMYVLHCRIEVATVKAVVIHRLLLCVCLGIGYARGENDGK